MFDDAMFGGNSLNMDAAAYEAQTPALPARGGTSGADGIGNDGMGNVTVPLMGQQQMMSGNGGPPPMPPPPPGAIVMPVSGGGVMGQQSMMQQAQAGATWDAMEPTDTSEPAAVRSAGFTALLIAACTGVGVAVGGPWGAAAGLLAAGALANGYRAQKWWDSAVPSEKHEAVVSGIFAAGTLGMGAYAAYKAYQEKEGGGGGSSGSPRRRRSKPKQHDEDDDEDEE